MASVALGMVACGGQADDLAELGVEESGEQLTVSHGAQLPAPGQVLDSCFLTTNFPDERDWIQKAMYQSWEFVSDIHFNWLGTCSGNASMVRVGIQASSDGTVGGWASGVGLGALRDSRAINDATQSTPVAQKPSLKIWAGAPSGRGRLEYIAVHELGHVLGFDDEGSRDLDGDGRLAPNDQDDCATYAAAGRPVYGDAITEYDIDSIMNYCNWRNNSSGALSGLDVDGAQGVYGIGKRFTAAVVAVL